MKKIKLDSEDFLKPVVNYMLREFNADYNYVKKHNEINGVPWFQYFWDTPESKEEFLTWLEKFIKANVNYRPHKIKNVINYIDLMYGLKVYENE